MTVDLPAATPADVGWNAEVLNGSLSELLGTNGTRAAALLADGKLIWEQYWDGHGPDTRFDVYSAAKGYAAVAIGLLVDDGEVNVDDPACRFLSEWDREGHRDITIRHLLTMTSGLHLDFQKFCDSPDPTATTLEWPLDHKPGTVWCYEQATVQALCPIVKRVSGKQPIELLQERVLGPIGAPDVDWLRAENGDCKTWRSTLTSARDVCKFGWFLHNNGEWNGQRLLSEDFCSKIRVRDPLFESVTCESEQQQIKSMNYGWLVYINPNGLWPDADPRAFAPTGRYGNLCLIDPVRHFVLARLVTPADADDHTPYENKLDNLSGGTNEVWKVLLDACA